MSKLDIYKIAVIGLLILNLGTLGLLLFRGHQPPPRGPMGEGPKQLIIERLHFDESQVNAYEKLVQWHRGRMRALEDSAGIIRDALYATLNTGDASAKTQALADLLRVTTAMEAVNYQHFEDIKNLCRPSQIEYFNQLTGELSKLFGAKGGHLPPPIPPKTNQLKRYI